MRKAYHFIGIGGIGMSALAQIAMQRAHHVSGSDLEINARIETLAKAGAKIFKGHSADQIQGEMTVVYSSDIKETNPEYLAALEKGCQILHRAELLAELIKNHKSLAVAGTHGKTTTSALLSTVLEEASFDPTYAIGGELIASDNNSRVGQSSHFVLEADESDQSFLKYHPYGAIVTNIDKDHLVNYQNDFGHLISAFKTFIDQVESPEHFFWCGDDPQLSLMNPKGNSYGFSSSCHWKISNVQQKGFQTVFDIKYQNSFYPQVTVNTIGHHNVLNTAAVFGLALLLGINESNIRKSLNSFKGIKRRCEIKNESDGILFLDDYAHHPTELTTTLQGIRQAVGEKKIVAIFQPHHYSRTQECLELYQNCFQYADEVVVTDIYAAGELQINSLSGESVVEVIRKNHSACYYVPRTALAHKLSKSLIKNDILVTLGAGDINKVSNEIVVILDRQSR